MPIRINFLAEEQAIEELRRRDPVKRAVMAAAGVVGLVVVFVIVLVVLGLKAKGTLKDREDEWAAMEKEVKAVEDDEKRKRDIEDKLTALSQLSTNRFLWGPVLNALQQCVVENIQVARFVGDQSYMVDIPPPPARGSKEKPKPATSTERVVLRIRAIDTGTEAERSYDKFRTTIANHPYFSERLVKPNGVRFTQPPSRTIDPRDPSKPIKSFEIECVYPEVVRQ